MPRSAFVIPVPAAERLVGDLRLLHDRTAGRGVPAHITLLVPFMAPALIDDAVLETARLALSPFQPFHFLLGSTGRFPTTAFLVPEPSAPFAAMTRALWRVFPDWPPYGGAHADVLPHLTVADGDAGAAASVVAELGGRLDLGGPVVARCDAVWLLVEDEAGGWSPRHRFALSDPAATRSRV
jgi:hypothetical protein